jgi:hypothetical protein
MSRSYKKIPYCGDHKGKNKKRTANKHLRSILKQDIETDMNFGRYKKYYETYDICDYYWFCTWEEYWERELRSYEYFKEFYPDSRFSEKPDKKECYREWLKWYRNK